jgi:hypothetical protein
MSKNNWHDINEPGYLTLHKKETAAKPVQQAQPDSIQKITRAQPIARLSDPVIVPGENSTLAFNGKCTLRVSISFSEPTVMKRVIFDLFSVCRGKQEVVQSGLEGFENGGITETTATLYYPQSYNDGDRVEYFFEASHTRCSKKAVSSKIRLPMLKISAKIKPKYNPVLKASIVSVPEGEDQSE